MIRPSRRSSRSAALLWATHAVACTSVPQKPAVPAPGPEHAAHAPAGLVVDPPSEVPRATTIVQSGTSVMSLTPPISDNAASDVVRTFFRAITDENLDVLATLLTPDATVPTTTRGATTSLLDHWRGRMNHLRYQALANDELYDADLIEAYRFHDWDVLLPGRPPRPAHMGPSDVLLRIPMQLVRSGNERVFGDEILLVLRRQRDTLAIAEQIEDFPLP
jgi:hypothetical protein